ncbi:MAG: sugar ABC transporter permease, partial [Spirochaetales bacterium]|nr:sugar ABC transporter permease [Spirochaetales bacterium]
WVVVGSIVNVFLLPKTGIITSLLLKVGIDAKWLIEPEPFRWVLVFSDIWKNAGWGTIIYMASLSAIDQQMYEAASIDGASKSQQIWRITLPCILSTIITIFILRIGGILSAGFEQVFVMQNDAVYMTSEIIDTYVYNRGFLKSDYGFGAAVGLFKSVIGLMLVTFFNWVSRKVGEGNIW